MRTTWEIQCKGLWGLSLGFPSAAYSLHFISWLTRCVAIHLELLRSFDPPFLQALFLRDKKSSLQLKSPCLAGGCCWRPGWRWAARFPHAKGTGPAVSSTPQKPPRTVLGQLRVCTPTLCQSRHVSWQCFLCATPWLWEVSPIHSSMAHTAVAWVLLDVYACFGEALNLQKPSPPLHTQASITSIQEFQRIFFTASDLHMVCSVQA